MSISRRECVDRADPTNAYLDGGPSRVTRDRSFSGTDFFPGSQSMADSDLSEGDGAQILQVIPPLTAPRSHSFFALATRPRCPPRSPQDTSADNLPQRPPLSGVQQPDRNHRRGQVLKLQRRLLADLTTRGRRNTKPTSSHGARSRPRLVTRPRKNERGGRPSVQRRRRKRLVVPPTRHKRCHLSKTRVGKRLGRGVPTALQASCPR